MSNVDLYEYAYQVIAKSIEKRDPSFQKSDLRRMTIEAIRRKLKHGITLEDVDSYDFRNWSAEKKLNWLQDLNEFVYKTLGKKKCMELREFK